MVRRRDARMTSPDQASLHTLVDDPLPSDPPPAAAPEKASAARRWMLLAVASGGCAAFNGMFAKLYVSSLQAFVVFCVFCELGVKMCGTERGLTA